mgnify:CR=1 FL=1
MGTPQKISIEGHIIANDSICRVKYSLNFLAVVFDSLFVTKVLRVDSINR